MFGLACRAVFFQYASKSKAKPVRGRGMQTRTNSLSGRSSQGSSLTRTQIMTAYKAQLHEYRALQEELGPWTKAFKDQHGCKPGLKDVEQTGILMVMLGKIAELTHASCLKWLR